jgi:hypothetical protein
MDVSKDAKSGDATKAFNFLQDQLGKPRIDEVWYDFDSDFSTGAVPLPETGWRSRGF